MDDELVVDVGFGVFIGRVARVPGLDDVPRGFRDGEVEAVYAGERGGEVSRVALDCVGWAWVGLGEGKKHCSLYLVDGLVQVGVVGRAGICVARHCGAGQW